MLQHEPLLTPCPWANIENQESPIDKCFLTSSLKHFRKAATLNQTFVNSFRRRREIFGTRNLSLS